MDLSRREILKIGLGGTVLLGTGLPILRAAEDKVKIPVGLQLYTVRDACSKDLPGTLAQVAKIGYKGVEFAGYYGRNTKDLRKLLDDNGVKCCGTHIGVESLLGDQLQRTVEFNKTIGNRYLVVASMGGDRLGTVDRIKKTAALFTEIAGKVKDSKMRMGYHSHGGDFKKLDGQTEWDIFFSNAGPDVIMQLDTGHCLEGGGDPYAILKKFPGRTTTIHLKEFGGKKGAVIGEGKVKWDEVFKLCETPGKTEWYIVDQESFAGTPMDSAKGCFEGLRKMGKV